MMRMPFGWGGQMTPHRNWAVRMAWVVDCRRNGLGAIWAGAGVGQLPTVGPATWGGATVDCSLNGSRRP